MNAPLDRRIHAVREDLADSRLKGRVEAARFVDGEPMRVVLPAAPLRRRPMPDAPLETEALLGEPALVFEHTAEGWAWVQLEGDGYVGWMPQAALGPSSEEPTHVVSVPRTLLFPGPDIKLPPIDGLPLGARVTATGEAQDRNATYRLIAGQAGLSGAVVAQHLAPLKSFEPDFVAVAERFLGVPYLWGGKTMLGIDCSGLVQMALTMSGQSAPRDTDMQEQMLGTPLADDAALARGDLVFWKGHVGIMRDAETLLHANAFHMMTAVEPLAETVARYSAKGVEITSMRRLA
ncbi:NlpC/P60 family protein [Mangrovicella endophytica]|uniref:C40 family peptidase n=1 Tax=Mangrovicella endophytica TaxID=2066697 RepID=UPI000C9DE969|nr:NlpC/P60 family protein [Mangrovicella endophytica]